MKILSEHLNTLRDLYINQMQHLHSGEEQIADGLKKMIKAARSPELKAALDTHLRETYEHAARLEQILVTATNAVHSKKNKAIASLLSEGDDTVLDTNLNPVRDAAIIAAAQRVEHYEIAAYGTLKRYAQILGETQQAQVLQQTLDEEKHADQVLNDFAETANQQADRAA
jgi:ferritin-like metal-binding protein YciE